MAGKTNKTMTLDDLALMVGRGFNDVTERMSSVEGRMDALATREDLKTLEAQVGRLEAKTDRLADDVRVVKTALENSRPESSPEYHEWRASMEKRVLKLEGATMR